MKDPMNRYREIMIGITNAFPRSQDIEIIVTLTKDGAREFQENLNEHIENYSNTIHAPDLIDRQYKDKSFTEVMFPLLGRIKLNIVD